MELNAYSNLIKIYYPAPSALNNFKQLLYNFSFKPH